VKFKIIHKLFILATLPVFTLLLFSINHINSEYKTYKDNEKLLVHSELIKKFSTIIHELQIERGLSLSHLSMPSSEYFSNALKKHQKVTDIEIEKFNKYIKNINSTFLNTINDEVLSSIQLEISNLKKIREDLNKKSISPEQSFMFFTNIIKRLLELVNNTKVSTNNEKLFNNILIFKKLLTIQEFAGQERVLISYIINSGTKEQKTIQRYNYLVVSQQENSDYLNIFFKDSKVTKELYKINKEYKSTYFSTVKELINRGSNSDEILNSEKWFSISSKRIDEIHNLENEVFKNIKENISTIQDDLKVNLLYKIVISLTTIIFLLLGSYILAKRIQTSIYNLEKGIKAFFEYLNFQKKLPEEINTHSNDEINDIAQSINTQIISIQKNLEKDKDFIEEATQVVTLMKNGDFTEKPYYCPNNPNLIELKTVFDELIELISQKIAQQTKSLAELNSSLEDKVFNQTLELHKKIEELTVARDNAIQAEIAKDEFLANMSHEIRTPLNAILGFVTILKKRIEDEKSTNYLNIIDTSGQSLLTIINDILDFSKIKSGKFTISPHPVDALEEFSNAVLLFASKAYEKHLIYSVYIDPNMPKQISFDSVRVKQILSNLLSNAIKFTPEDGVINVKITCEGTNLVIIIQDSGIGISKENQPKIFSAFEQADGSTTRKYGGTGLGLSISAKLASLMDGTLTLQSDVGKGSIFILNIPVEIVDGTPHQLIDSKSISNIKFALLKSSHTYLDDSILIKQYLTDFGVKDILELDEYQEDGYDILFFTPDDDYNEEIVLAEIPAIAMLRTNTVTLANLEYIQSLYAPFIPKLIVQAINDTGIENIKYIDMAHVAEDTQEELKFDGSILVAEDNKTNQMLISLLLDDYEIDYKIANNGLEAVEMFKEEKFDMVLMDENMPELNGIAAMQQIKEYETQNSMILTPVVALTASVLDSDKERFLNAGMDGFVGKPINTEELESELSKYLKRKT